MRNQFEKQLSILHEDLIRMGTLLEKSLEKVIQILKTPDDDTMKDIKELEIEVDELERKVQSQSLRILFTQQPVAGDLRSISTALNLITDMERIADQAYDIGEICMFFKDKERTVPKPDHLVSMVNKCINMVKGSVDAYVTQNLAVARDVIAADDEVDDLFLQVREDIIDLINQNRANGEQATDYLMIAKYLERIADHAVNIAEWVIFNITGEHKNQPLL